MAVIDIYEIRYRDIQLSGNSMLDDEPDMTMDTWIGMNISRDTEKEVYEVINDVNNNNGKQINKMAFSEAIYTIFPQVNTENNQILLTDFTPIFYNEKENENKDPKEHINRFKYFDVEKLPLIEIAKLINVKVEKSNQMEEYGIYRYRDRKIIMGCDNLQTFLHELAHAIVDYLCDDIEDKNMSEQVAELSASALAKKYNIPRSITYTAEYLKRFPVSDSDKEEVYKWVKKIMEFVKQAKGYIERQKNP